MLSEALQRVNFQSVFTGGRRRRTIWLLLSLLAPPAAIAVAFQLQPTYVAINIPVIPSAVGYFWWEEQLSQLAYADSWGVLYLRRQVGTAHPSMQGWQTAEEVHAYLGTWLTDHGWSYVGLSTDSDPALPESRFLARQQRRYYHLSTDRYIGATVAVWPTALDGFNVVVTTERPSWGRRLNDAFD